jgi:hypothetical protein
VALPDAVARRRGGGRRPNLGPDHDPLDQRDLLPEILPAVRRAAGVAGAQGVAGGGAAPPFRRSRDAARAGRGRGAHEAARQRLPGRRRGRTRIASSCSPSSTSAPRRCWAC